MSLSSICFYFITFSFNIDGMKGITHAIVNGWYEASVKYCLPWEPLFQLFTQQEVPPRFPQKTDFYFL